MAAIYAEYNPLGEFIFQAELARHFIRTDTIDCVVGLAGKQIVDVIFHACRRVVVVTLLAPSGVICASIDVARDTYRVLFHRNFSARMRRIASGRLGLGSG
ncbi:hypothetical protein G432_09285 [Sphingomonas sp. MM-1]|nr:hypothetical protein G432_09285 [Sphingomonas sp. MM-1]